MQLCANIRSDSSTHMDRTWEHYTNICISKNNYTSFLSARVIVCSFPNPNILRTTVPRSRENISIVPPQCQCLYLIIAGVRVISSV